MKVYQRQHKQAVRWCCDFHVAPLGEDRPDRFRLTAPANVTTQAAAERWARQQFAAIAAKGRPANTRKARAALVEQAEQAERERVPTLGEWWPQYEEQLALERRKPAGQASRRSIFEIWLAPFIDLDLHACCSDLVVRRLRMTIAASPKKISTAHTNGIVVTLLACLRRAAIEHPHLGLVVPRVKALPSDAVAIDCYPIADTMRMLATCNSKDRACVLLMLDAGLRAGEVCALRWADVSLTLRHLTVRGTVFRDKVNAPKSGKPRTVPMTTRLCTALDLLSQRGGEWVCPASQRAGPGAYETLAYRVLRVCVRADVEHRGCHALRHTYATESLRAGVDLRTLQDRLGHADIKVTSVYLHPSGVGERRGMDAFEARLQTPEATVTDLALARSRRRSN